MVVDCSREPLRQRSYPTYAGARAGTVLLGSDKELGGSRYDYILEIGRRRTLLSSNPIGRRVGPPELTADRRSSGIDDHCTRSAGSSLPAASPRRGDEMEGHTLGRPRPTLDAVRGDGGQAESRRRYCGRHSGDDDRRPARLRAEMWPKAMECSDARSSAEAGPGARDRRRRPCRGRVSTRPCYELYDGNASVRSTTS